MRKWTILLCVLAVLVWVIPVQAFNGPSVPDGYEVELLADNLDTPKGITSPMHRAGAGQFGHYLYVAVSEVDAIYKVEKEDGAGAEFFASSSSFPVGVSFFGGPFGKYLYVGNALGGGGITRVGPAGGDAEAFALSGKNVAGLDFGRGKYGNDMYAGEWDAGNIYRVAPNGSEELFAAIPNVQTRYLKFSPGIPMLFFTDFPSGDVYYVAPNGSATPFAHIGVPGVEGFDFGPGGAFKDFMYVGSIVTGDIWTVDANGDVALWASGFEGVADIYFEPGEEGGFVMYVVTGGSKVYAIDKE